MIASCGNNETESKKVAKDKSDNKFNTTSFEDYTQFAVAAADGGMMEVKLDQLAAQIDG